MNIKKSFYDELIWRKGWWMFIYFCGWMLLNTGEWKFICSDLK